jgi:hypothetical protein
MFVTTQFTDNVVSGKRSQEGLTSTALIFILIGSAPLLRAKSQKVPKDQKFIFLLPNGFRGWVCVDFGIEGAMTMGI